MSLSTEPRIGTVRARAYRIPTDRPEADGTLEWRATTLVLAEIEAGPVTGLGYSYTDASAARLVASTLGEALHGQVLSDHPAMLAGMWRAVRILGRAGLAAAAIPALDIALWGARAKWLDLPLAWLLGRAPSASRSTAAAVSPATTSPRCRPSSKAGGTKASVPARSRSACAMRTT